MNARSSVASLLVPLVVVMGACEGGRADVAQDGGGQGADAFDGAPGPGACGEKVSACQDLARLPTAEPVTLVGVTDSYIYYTTASTVSRMPVRGGGGVQELGVAAQDERIETAIVDTDEANLYYVLRRAGEHVDTAIMRVLLPAGAPMALDEEADRPSGQTIGDIVLVGSDLYFSVTSGMQGDTFTAGGLYRISVNGGVAVRVLAADEGQGVRAFNGDVYFSGRGVEGTGSGAALIRLPAGGGAAQILIAGSAPEGMVSEEVPMSFDVGPRGIFWNDLHSHVMNLPLDGSGAPKSLFTAPFGDRSLAILNSNFAGVFTASAPEDVIYVGLHYFPVPDNGRSTVVRVPLDGTSWSYIFSSWESFSAGRLILRGSDLYFSYPDSPIRGAIPGIVRVNAWGCPTL